jgi:hypothetical protein
MSNKLKKTKYENNVLNLEYQLKDKNYKNEPNRIFWS